MTYCWRTIDKRTLKPTKTNKQNDNPNARTREKLQWDSRRNAIMLKSNPIPARLVAHELENNIPKKFSLCYDSSRSQIRLPNLEIWQSHWGSLGHLTLKGRGIWLQNFHNTGENRHGGHKQNLVSITTQGKGVVTPRKAERDLPVSIWESPAEAWVRSSLLQGQWLWQQGYWQVHVGMSPFGGHQ